jgi:hypothetical protein
MWPVSFIREAVLIIRHTLRGKLHSFWSTVANAASIIGVVVYTAVTVKYLFSNPNVSGAVSGVGFMLWVVGLGLFPVSRVRQHGFGYFLMSQVLAIFDGFIFGIVIFRILNLL